MQVTVAHHFLGADMTTDFAKVPEDILYLIQQEIRLVEPLQSSTQ